MASRRLPSILAMEIESAGWQANSSVGDTQAYPRDEHCQSAVGSAADPWRTPQARRRYRTDERGQVHGDETRRPKAGRSSSATMLTGSLRWICRAAVNVSR